MVKPLLLIDVDGVLNPYAASGVPTGYTLYDSVGGYKVRLNPAHGQQLRALEPLFDLVWCTTWEHEANTLIAPLIGLDVELPVIELRNKDDPDRYDQWQSWKMPHIIAFVGDRPFAWVDDDIFRDARSWATKRREGSTLLLRIDPAQGLTKRHFETLWKFGQSHAIDT